MPTREQWSEFSRAMSNFAYLMYLMQREKDEKKRQKFKDKMNIEKEQIKILGDTLGIVSKTGLSPEEETRFGRQLYGAGETYGYPFRSTLTETPPMGMGSPEPGLDILGVGTPEESIERIRQEKAAEEFGKNLYWEPFSTKVGTTEALEAFETAKDKETRRKSIEDLNVKVHEALRDINKEEGLYHLRTDIATEMGLQGEARTAFIAGKNPATVINNISGGDLLNFAKYLTDYASKASKQYDSALSILQMKRQGAKDEKTKKKLDDEIATMMEAKMKLERDGIKSLPWYAPWVKQMREMGMPLEEKPAPVESETNIDQIMRRIKELQEELKREKQLRQGQLGQGTTTSPTTATTTTPAQSPVSRLLEDYGT